MAFIKLTASNNIKSEVFINMDKVITFEKIQKNSTFIQFLNEFDGGEADYFYAKESPEEILKLIKESE